MFRNTTGPISICAACSMEKACGVAELLKEVFAEPFIIFAECCRDIVREGRGSVY